MNGMKSRRFGVEKGLSQRCPLSPLLYIYKAKMSVCVSVCHLSVCLSTHQLSMVDLRAKPVAYLESAGSCGCFSLVLND